MADEAVGRGRTARKVRPIRVDGDVAYVTLTRGLVAVIDAADVGIIDQWNWHAQVHHTGHAYAYRTTAKDGKNRPLAMHRALTGAPAGTHVDHRDGDGLNNRRSNLRVCTHAENMQNRVLDRRNRFGASGVWARRGKYRACIKINRRTIHLGTFETPEEAAAAYHGAAKVLFGEFARAA